MSIQGNWLNSMGQIGMMAGMASMSSNLNNINRSIQDINDNISDMNVRNELNAKYDLIQQLKTRLSDLEIKIAEYKMKGQDISALIEIYGKEVERHNDIVKQYNDILDDIERQKEAAKAKKVKKAEHALISGLVIIILIAIAIGVFFIFFNPKSNGTNSQLVYAVCRNCQIEYGHEISTNSCPVCGQYITKIPSPQSYKHVNGYEYKK